MSQFYLLHTQNVCLFLFLPWTFPLCVSHLAKEYVHLSMPFQNLFSWISFFVHSAFSMTYFLLIAFIIIFIFLLYIFLVMLGIIPALVFCHYSSMPSFLLLMHSLIYLPRPLLSDVSTFFIWYCIIFFISFCTN